MRPADQRGHANHGWLDSWHSFSFADYHDPAHVQWGPLRVINEDRVAPGQGFGTHSHRDMEIISYVLEGSLGHKDSMGNAENIVPGEVQRLSAGTGITHSEFNYSDAGTTHFLQIWIIPRVLGVTPDYAQTYFGPEEKRGRLRRVVSPDGIDGSVPINQDASMFAGLFDGAESAALALAPGRLGYVHVAKGQATINGIDVGAGDALLYRDEASVTIDRGNGAEVLVFDLPDRS
jgi:redox-sensitive bicupin YhaK (pirin superfamily)